MKYELRGRGRFDFGDLCMVCAMEEGAKNMPFLHMYYMDEPLPAFILMHAVGTIIEWEEKMTPAYLCIPL